MDLVLEVHVVDARLHLERAGLDAEAALDVVRGLGLQPEILGRAREGCKRQQGSGGDTFLDIRRAECVRGAAEYREHVVEAMLKTDMQRVVGFAAVERECCGFEAEGAGRVGIQAIARAEPCVLNPGTVGEVGGRQQADRMLPVSGQRLLRQVVDVDRLRALEQRPLRIVGGIVVIDTGQDLRRHAEQRVLDAQARRDRPGLQMAVDVVEGNGQAACRRNHLADFLSRTPPSTIRSTPSMIVLVKPAVALAPCWLP